LADLEMRIMRKFWLVAVLLPGVLLAENLSLCYGGSSPNATSTKAAAPETGLASYYAEKYHGRPTASGEIFDTSKLTAAHRTLPFGTMVKVTHVGNRRSVTVRINDRGPFVTGRVIDLSRSAARELHLEKAGLANVKIEILPATTAASHP
jgi:rare lipoprotein A